MASARTKTFHPAAIRFHDTVTSSDPERSLTQGVVNEGTDDHAIPTISATHNHNCPLISNSGLTDFVEDVGLSIPKYYI